MVFKAGAPIIFAAYMGYSGLTDVMCKIYKSNGTEVFSGIVPELDSTMWYPKQFTPSVDDHYFSSFVSPGKNKEAAFIIVVGGGLEALIQSLLENETYGLAALRSAIFWLNDISAVEVRAEVDGEFTERGATSARFAKLDEITSARMAELDVTNIPADLNVIKEATYTIDGAVVADGGNTASTFKTDLTQANDDFYKDIQIKLTSGANAGQAKRISAYTGATKFITVAAALLQTPAAGDKFQIIPLVAGTVVGGGDATYAMQVDIHDDLADEIAREAGATTENTYPHPSGTGEGTIFTLSLTKRTVIHAVKIYTKNLTKSTAFRCFLKDNDGVYTQSGDDLIWTTADKDVVLFTGLVHDRDIQFRMQSAEAEGVPRDVPYSVIKEEMNA